MTKQVILKKDREKSVLNKHPWLFSGAINRLEGNPESGDVVDVWNSKARFVARGIYNEKSQISVRLLTWNPNDPIDEEFWRRRISRAVAGRLALKQDQSTNAYRLVYSEADGVPGFIADLYGTWLVVQFLSLAAEKNRKFILNTLLDLVEPQGIYERSDSDSREKEGLVPVTGPVWGEIPPDLIEIIENGLTFQVDVKLGHKTGFYLDQRENRMRASKYFAGKEVLNAFAYTGAFSVYAARAGATRVINVDSSERSLQIAENNMLRNGFNGREDVYSAADVFDVLRAYREAGWKFDVIVLDPPKFAHSKRNVEKASHGYKDINLLAMKLLKRGGILITFSCSGVVSSDLFQKILFGASLDASRTVQIIERLSQGSDHPVLLTCPESEYLKGLVCRVW
ncbi:MAG TPA: class I SAM-dependent rRNA methyltransferase [Anaerolineae bacterium]|nr:class I SAM-dependent rRNA methyltransferase [Anaerolineae bacterium]MCB9102456.1 class I SAM-dependent rRNA methyltransferase [Anaerolineales bacterium]MCB0180685.1 class I SAM-dependent rRNA methyltransferase [Anaerolineae bacterium]MCB0223554.1 class I SAM-dependent rRNA methyltransferase [Anaerolineae bacterium]MCB9107052.1 class I SAM-dependent rRNA methyltransferase [Anaerolineales bacterium]